MDVDSSRKLRAAINLFLLFAGISLLSSAIFSFLIVKMNSLSHHAFSILFTSMFVCYVCIFVIGRITILLNHQKLIVSQKNLDENKEKLAAVLNTIVDAIITTDDKGFIYDVNPAAERMFGYTQAELMGKRVTMLTPDDATVLNKNIDSKIKELTGIKKMVIASLLSWV